MLVIVGIRTETQDLTSQMGIGSESHCLLGQLKRILEISDSEAGIKVVKSGGVDGRDGKCGERESGLLVSAIRSLEILSVKKEPKLSARDTTEEIEGNGDGSLRCRRLLTVCQRCLGLTEEEETKLE